MKKAFGSALKFRLVRVLLFCAACSGALAQSGGAKRTFGETLRALNLYWGADIGCAFNNQFAFGDIAEKAGDTVTVREIALRDGGKNGGKPFAFPLAFEIRLHAGYPLPALKNSAVEIHAGVTLGGTRVETDFYSKETYKESGAGTVKAYDFFLADNSAFNIDADFIYNFAPLFNWPSRIMLCAGAGAGYAIKFSPWLVEYDEATDDWPDNGGALTRPAYKKRGIAAAPPGFYLKAAIRGGFDYGKWRLYAEPALQFFPLYAGTEAGNVTGNAPSAYGDEQYMRSVSVFASNSLKFTLGVGFSIVIGEGEGSK
jgi:hypothetical protein